MSPGSVPGCEVAVHDVNTEEPPKSSLKHPERPLRGKKLLDWAAGCGRRRNVR